MQDRPTAEELLDAVAGFLRERADRTGDRWERFQFQVAANSLGIVRREYELEDGFMRDEWRRLDGLIGNAELPEGQHDLAARMRLRNDDLAQRIRRGEFDGEREGRLLPHLWQTVVDKVRIASPNERP